MNTPAVISLTLGVVLIGALAAFMRKGYENLGPNSAVGIRTKATKASPAAWRVGHEAASPFLMAAVITAVTVVVLTIGATIASALSDSTVTDHAAVAIPAIGLAVEVVILILATAQADKAAKSAR
ncbi:SdpI family protein [Rhodococcus sp. NBC_00294]|uniref:SdpI family protein n=1 Tax=Rhodococcus sp. NBC_00294 TaxID=2976004 RepID=UPI002E2A7BC5|nr:SdpI family protein [Rhodococcus sp. NBC_00294]